MRRRRLSLHHLILPELGPVEFVPMAARLGCEHVCLFTQMPGDAKGLPVVERSALADVARVMDDTGVSALGVTSFPILPTTDVTAYEVGLDHGARLSASRANARILDDDRARAADRFAAFAELCAAREITACIEFTGFEDPASIERAQGILRHAGSGALTLDALHLVRTGTPWAVLEALPPELIGYVQICDGPLQATLEDYEREGPLDRLPPGDGEFPLDRLMRLLPVDLPLCLEVPSLELRQQGLCAEDIALRIVSRTRSWLETINLT